MNAVRQQWDNVHRDVIVPAEASGVLRADELVLPGEQKHLSPFLKNEFVPKIRDIFDRQVQGFLGSAIGLGVLKDNAIEETQVEEAKRLGLITEPLADRLIQSAVQVWSAEDRITVAGLVGIPTAALTIGFLAIAFGESFSDLALFGKVSDMTKTTFGIAGVLFLIASMALFKLVKTLPDGTVKPTTTDLSADS